ncbi:helix-turn-helix domain-containing protein, partial [Dickeya dadantii]|uniref:helix-turn-helix domain-containing protein n=1 Tax=Dickeya dadantii TaxID=204038 RepID=UPI00345B388C
MATPQVFSRIKTLSRKPLSLGQGWNPSHCRNFCVRRTSVRRWVRAFQLHGIDGITWKTTCHSADFRLIVVQAVLNEELSMREAAARFNISNET